ncbi:MFS transporter [Actinomadura rudentiformis]|uniref:MFS transporter n=1 Tax=Actinomadura rudentiformis TaxID=359158 RepID=A0A6H9YQM8_9ACTN|nr:MFS transporter [Actinomadura rudentiformis]KAB2349737.1 MFS transporter [Actinomadura rudentiformis]
MTGREIDQQRSLAAADGRRSACAAGILALVCAAQFMVVLDVSVVNVALPSIKRSLDFSAAALPWVATSYALAFGGFLLLGGRLADLYGHRRVFVAGLAVFTAASLAGGLATTAGLLIGARAVQGLGAAVLAPVTLTVLTVTFPEGAARTRALAIWTAVSLAGGAAGNLVGGALTEYLSWRSILLVNVPIGVTALAAARLLPGGTVPGRAGRLDVPGAVLATLGLVAITYALSPSESRPGAVTAALWAAGTLAVAAFAVVEARLAAWPLLPPRLLRRRAVWLGNGVMLLAGAAFQVPMWYFLTLYMQNVLNLDALQTGLGFLPHTVLTLLIGLRVTPRLMRHVDTRVLIVAGVWIAAAGFAWQSQITADDTYWSGVLGPAVLMSVGGALFNTPLTSIVTSGVHAADAGVASGLMNTAKQVGGAVGLAALVALTTAPASGAASVEAALAAQYGQAFALTAGVLMVVGALAFALPPRRDDTGTARPRFAGPARSPGSGMQE